jgi:uncharacterized membrane protein
VRERAGSDWLRNAVAMVFRVGALVSLGVIAIGYVLSLAVDDEPAGGSLVAQVTGGGPAAIMALGLFGLTLLPVGVVIALLAGFARSGERGRSVTAASVLILLVASLVAAALLTPAG